MLRGRLGILYGISFAAHAGVAFAVASIQVQEAHEATRITVREHKQKAEEKKKAEPPPPPIVAAPKPVRRAPKPVEAAPAPAPVATAAPAAAASSAAPVADFGLSMTGGSGPGGMAVPVASARPAPTRVTKTAAPKAL